MAAPIKRGESSAMKLSRTAAPSNSSTAHKVEDEQDHGDDQNDVDESTRDVEGKAAPRKVMTKELEKLKAQVYAKVEPPFHVVKNRFRYRMTRYGGLANNPVQLHTLYTLANLVLAKRTLLVVTAE